MMWTSVVVVDVAVVSIVSQNQPAISQQFLHFRVSLGLDLSAWTHEELEMAQG